MLNFANSSVGYKIWDYFVSIKCQLEDSVYSEHFSGFVDFLNMYTLDALHNLVAFVQFEKREKHLWRNDFFKKVVGFNLQVY